VVHLTKGDIKVRPEGSLALIDVATVKTLQQDIG
jgi:hypothetical protein